jgi:simple sugar transport system ATP-binding protein
MTVAENVALGGRMRWGFFGGFRPAEAAERVRSVAADAGLTLDPGMRVSDLPVGAQQRLEIVKALARDARLLIFDEPTAVLSPREAQDLYRWLRAFVARGHTVVLITHKVREALAIADDVTVLRRGRTVLRGATRELPEDSVVRALLGGGAPSTGTGGTSRGEQGPPQLEIDSVSVEDARGITRLRDATLTVHAGEIVGVAGVEGAGQRELLRVLAGRLVPTVGSVRIAERTGFVPEDRLVDALVPAMTLVENFALKESGSARGRLPWSGYRRRTEATIAGNDVRAEHVTSLAAALSGGNQQKFVLGRELEGAPQALVVENPTRGLDIRATATVLDRLREARAAGVAVVMYSSDLDEVLSVADRTVVCFDGRLVATKNDAESAARAMVGAS